MMTKDLVCKKIDTVGVVVRNLDKQLESLRIRTASIGISVHNFDIDALKGIDKDYEKSIDTFSGMIHTLHKMYDDIVKSVTEWNEPLRRIQSELLSIDKEIHTMKYHVFYIRKATETDSLIDLKVIAKEFMKDIGDLKRSINELKDKSERLRHELCLVN